MTNKCPACGAPVDGSVCDERCAEEMDRRTAEKGTAAMTTSDIVQGLTTARDLLNMPSAAAARYPSYREGAKVAVESAIARLSATCATCQWNEAKFGDVACTQPTLVEASYHSLSFRPEFKGKYFACNQYTPRAEER